LQDSRKGLGDDPEVQPEVPVLDVMDGKPVLRRRDLVDVLTLGVFAR
jgi:hypothetical protein